MIYTSLYLNAKLKIFSNYHPHYYKFVLFFAPILGAVLIAGSLTIDEFHHWYDVLAGSIIGTAMAVAAYRFVYAGVADWRVNHVPLSRVPDDDLDEDAYATRKGSWGDLQQRKVTNINT